MKDDKSPSIEVSNIRGREMFEDVQEGLPVVLDAIAALAGVDPDEAFEFVDMAVRCDAPGCSEKFAMPFATPFDELIAAAREEGWRGDGSQDLCPKHAQTPEASVLRLLSGIGTPEAKLQLLLDATELPQLSDDESLDLWNQAMGWIELRASDDVRHPWEHHLVLAIFLLRNHSLGTSLAHQIQLDDRCSSAGPFASHLLRHAQTKEEP